MNKYAMALTLFLCVFLSGCVGMPEKGIKPISGFNVERYLGTWYEIARFDHRFERGLTNVSATYSLRKDGNIRVINKGFNAQKGEWKEAEGVAKFIDKTNVAQLKVSFFGPFYGAYNVVELDKSDYSLAMVVANDRDYLWILSRTPTIAPERLKKLVDQAKRLNFDTQKLIYVDQKKNTGND